MNKVRVTKQYILSAMHNLERTDLDPSENEKLFGICYRWHGHDYKIQVELEAEIQSSGLSVDRNAIDTIVESTLLKPFTGSRLNDHFSNTSGEALCSAFFDLLSPVVSQTFKQVQLIGIHIQETRKNWFSYSPSNS